MESADPRDFEGTDARTPDRRRRRASHDRRHRLPRRSRRGRHPRWEARRYQRAARTRLQRFRQASVLAVSLTALLLLLWTSPATMGQQLDNGAAEQNAGQQQASDAASDAPTADPEQSLEEAQTTIRDLFGGFYGLLPKLTIAVLLILAALLLSHVIRFFLQRGLRHWERVDAVSAMVRIGLVLVAIGAGLSVIAGDARALVGSVGLVGLALSWALQTPIESFTGWVLNAFRTYYRPGDRIEVGDVHGDVYRIDILTTTVWQVGGPGKPVAGAQSTGALVTFPNWEVLRSNIINYSRDFPYVWDEVTIGIANESDLRYALQVLRRVAHETVGPMMVEPAQQYLRMLERERLAFDVESEPQLYLSLTDAWTNCTIRYLVPVRERRRWSSTLLLAVAEEVAKPEHAGRIIGSYPRTEIAIRNFTAMPGTEVEKDK